MEEHLWSSSFWRLLSNCSDSRKLLIVKKIILHKLGNKIEISDNPNKIINSKSSSLQDTHTSVKPVENDYTNPIIKQHLVSHLDKQNKEDCTVKSKIPPVMGTNALLMKYQNCVESEDSKIISNLVNMKFNKKYKEEEYPINVDTENKQIDDHILSFSTSCLDSVYEIPLTFDEETFLKEALGDELNSYTSGEFDCSDNEEDSMSDRPDLSISITSSRISSLLSRATSIYSTLKRKVRPRPFHQKKANPTTLQLQTNTEVDILFQEASIQHQIIIEACKALHVCLSSKQFIFGPEHIEAERILLLAVYKQSIVLKEIKQLIHFKEISKISKGFASISGLQFPLTTRIQKEGYLNWFTAIVSCGSSVTATNVTTADSDNIVRFEQEFKFENLPYDFEINVNIYSLLAKNSDKKYSHESKFHLKDEETVTCLGTPDKLLCRRNSIKRGRPYCSERREPAFKPWGKTTICISDLDRLAPFPLEQIPSGAILQGFVLMNFNTIVDFKENYSGFLTLRTECDKSMAWNHRWCNLKGDTLYYWNYPADEDITTPIGKINLQLCISSEISVADRNLCARPRTLLIETAESSDQGTVFLRHFLSADNTENMKLWKDRLNAILSELIKWNLMKCKVQLI